MLWRGSTVLLLLGALLVTDAPGQSPRSSLSIKTWTVAWVHNGGAPVPDRPATVNFDDQGRFTGSGGCNRLIGGYGLDAAVGIKFTAVASTRMLCEPPVNRYERALLAALETVDAFSFDKDGQLVLAKGDTALTILK